MSSICGRFSSLSSESPTSIARAYWSSNVVNGLFAHVIQDRTCFASSSWSYSCPLTRSIALLYAQSYTFVPVGSFAIVVRIALADLFLIRESR
jgi:hypothetical protein